MYLVERTSSSFSFSDAELERLSAYRAAVAAGFYTDWDGTATETDTHLLAWLATPPATAGGERYPFTTQERERLERYRTAAASGSYTDDRG